MGRVRDLLMWWLGLQESEPADPITSEVHPCLEPANNVDAHTPHQEHRRWSHRNCLVVCDCGHRSRGWTYGAVWKPEPFSAWRAHRRHAERAHNTDFSRQVPCKPRAQAEGQEVPA